MPTMKFGQKVRLADFNGVWLRVGERALELEIRGGERGRDGIRQLIDSLIDLETEMCELPDGGDGLFTAPVDWQTLRDA
jgi:hypothetical protein